MSSFSHEAQRNLGDAERRLSIAGGVLLALLALRRGSLTLAMAALAGFLLYRGARAYCPLWDALGVSSAAEMQRHHTDHLVDQASKESFPASDPPGWSTGSAFTQVSE